MTTIRERLIKGLLASGWAEDTHDKSKYTAFTKTGFEGKLFIGTNGAMRRGRCASASYSIADATRQTKFYIRILELGTEPEQLSKRDIVNQLLA